MQALTLASALQKHRIDSTAPWFVLLDIYPNKNDKTIVLRVARNTDDVIWRGNTYIAFSFEIDGVTQDSQGQLPNVAIRVSNVNRAVQGQLEPYQGGIGATVVLTVISAADMTGDPVQQYTWTILEASAADDWVSFTLGAPSPMLKKFPAGIFVKNRCGWVFNSPTLQGTLDPAGAQCGYEGGLTTCDKTLSGPNGCQVHGNQLRFGGVPGVDGQGFRAASAI